MSQRTTKTIGGYNVLCSIKLAEVQPSYKRKLTVTEMPQITTPYSAVEIFRKMWAKGKLQYCEEMYTIFLSASNQVLGWARIAEGGCNQVSIDPKKILTLALLTGSTAVVLGHNHPSGSLKPSREDLEFTKTMKSACKLVGLKLLDHIIITKESHNSIMEIDIN
jgi:DNA repair protein RadC